MVGADAGRQIGVERRAAHAGRVAVDVVGEARAELVDLGRRAGDHTWEIHHLGDADGAVAAEQARDVAGAQRPAR